MVELPSVSEDALSWTVQWLQVPLSGESEIVKADELERLRRDLVDRSAQDSSTGPDAAVAAAAVAVQLFELLLNRDPQAAGEYVRLLKQRLVEL